MLQTWSAWQRAAKLAWENLTRLIAVNLLWFLASLPLVTVGPATLALYDWLARAVRDGEDLGYGAFFQAMGRLAARGVVWSAMWASVLWLARVNIRFYSELFSPMGAAVVQVAWIYGLIFLGSMQPYLLEALAVAGKGWGHALKESAWQVLANPVYSHAQFALVAVGMAVGGRFATLIPVVLMAVALVFWSVAAADVGRKYGEPTRLKGRIEDVL